MTDVCAFCCMFEDVPVALFFVLIVWNIYKEWKKTLNKIVKITHWSDAVIALENQQSGIVGSQERSINKKVACP